jgi:hypothetical protein
MIEGVVTAFTGNGGYFITTIIGEFHWEHDAHISRFG